MDAAGSQRLAQPIPRLTTPPERGDSQVLAAVSKCRFPLTTHRQAQSDIRQRRNQGRAPQALICLVRGRYSRIHDASGAAALLYELRVALISDGHRAFLLSRKMSRPRLHAIDGFLCAEVGLSVTENVNAVPAGWLWRPTGLSADDAIADRPPGLAASSHKAHKGCDHIEAVKWTRGAKWVTSRITKSSRGAVMLLRMSEHELRHEPRHVVALIALCRTTMARPKGRSQRHFFEWLLRRS
jgi:hypothetical protein